MKSLRAYLFLGLLIVTAVLIAGCQEENPMPEFVVPSPTNTAAPPTSTQSPTRVSTATPQITNTPEPPIATATAIPTMPPTQTPIPQVIIEVLNSEDDQPIVGATVRLSQPARGYDATFLTLNDGLAYFINLIPSNVPYVAEINQPGFRPISMELTVSGGANTFTFNLERGAVATINTDIVNLRAGAGLTFDIVVEVSQDETFPVIGVSDDQEWFQVLTPDGVEGWVFADLVDIEGDLSEFGITSPPQPAPTQNATLIPTPTPEGEIGPTATPSPRPVRPPRVPFNAQALYQNMVEVQSAMVQLRGVLDRRNGFIIECEEFVGFYAQIVQIQTYRNVPEDWTRIHNLYVNSSNNAIDTNRAIYLQCLEGGGSISAFNFRNARNGIDFSLERLRIGIIGAEDRLGAP